MLENALRITSVQILKHIISCILLMPTKFLMVCVYGDLAVSSEMSDLPKPASCMAQAVTIHQALQSALRCMC